VGGHGSPEGVDPPDLPSPREESIKFVQHARSKMLLYDLGQHIEVDVWIVRNGMRRVRAKQFTDWQALV
jgi:hypothetical protein